MIGKLILLLLSGISFIAGAVNAWDGKLDIGLLFHICGWCILIYADLKSKDN